MAAGLPMADRRCKKCSFIGKFSISRRKEEQYNKLLQFFEFIKRFVSSPKADVTEVLDVTSNLNMLSRLDI